MEKERRERARDRSGPGNVERDGDRKREREREWRGDKREADDRGTKTEHTTILLDLVHCATKTPSQKEIKKMLYIQILLYILNKLLYVLIILFYIVVFKL